MKALISIDYTNDFVADDGSLTAGAPAQVISEAMASVVEAAFEAGYYIFLRLMPTRREIAFIRRQPCFHRIILWGQGVGTCMVL